MTPTLEALRTSLIADGWTTTPERDDEDRRLIREEGQDQ